MIDTQEPVVSAELVAVLVAVTDGEPRVLTTDGGQALPAGPFPFFDARELRAGERKSRDGEIVPDAASGDTPTGGKNPPRYPSRARPHRPPLAVSDVDLRDGAPLGGLSGDESNFARVDRPEQLDGGRMPRNFRLKPLNSRGKRIGLSHQRRGHREVHPERAREERTHQHQLEVRPAAHVAQAGPHLPPLGPLTWRPPQLLGALGDEGAVVDVLVLEVRRDQRGGEPGARSR